MDYPKSVPSVGLVNGKFVDENPVSGTPGSLIPSSWGNAVTDEILSVIRSTNVVPAESNNAQLTDAIVSIADLRASQAVSKAVVQASESASGVAKVASQAQTNSGVDDTTIVTPKKDGWCSPEPGPGCFHDCWHCTPVHAGSCACNHCIYGESAVSGEIPFGGCRF